jgi:hypothetical protein
MSKSQKFLGILVALSSVTAAGHASALESRGYVISWFATATNYDVADLKENCPEDRNKGRLTQITRDLMLAGYTKEEAETIMATAHDSIYLPENILRRVETRAVVNGKHVSIYNYPEAIQDPNIETVSSKRAYGFDLGSKNLENKFVDPQTGGPVDNQFWRAVGCQYNFVAAYPTPHYAETGNVPESRPGWTIRITGEDLSKDGKVKVAIDRTTQHLERDANAGILKNASYIVDPSSANHNEFDGEIKDGVLTITPGQLRLAGSTYGEIALRNTHMRLKLQGDSLTGFWGGFAKWETMAYPFTAGPNGGADSSGLYHAIKKMADASPDPKTGQNTEISVTFRLDAVPAYLLDANGTVVAMPGPGLSVPSVQTVTAPAR